MPTPYRHRYEPTGAMYYREAGTDRHVPVDGTPAAGDVPTAQDDGTVAWAAAATGLPPVPADHATVDYVLGTLGGVAAWRVVSGVTFADQLLAGDGAVLLAPDGGALTST